MDEEIPAPGIVSSQAAEVVVAAASAADFAILATGPTQYRFSRSYRPRWVVPTAIVGALFFGLGLLLLIFVPKRHETCLATVNDGRRGVTVRLSGVLPPGVIDQIRVGLGGSTAASMTTTSPVVPSAPHPPAPQPGVSPFSPVGPPPSSVGPPAGSSSGPSPAWAGSAASSWGPIADPGSAQPASVDATIARVPTPPVGPPVGPAVGAAVRIGNERIPLSGGVVIGRNPAAMPALPGARLVAVADAGLSKTHCAIRVTGAVVEVCDLSSTNGTAVEARSGRQSCVPGVWLAAGAGAVVVAGDQRLEILP